MNDRRTITFVLEDFPSPSPGQQLLDRFLIGYHREGQFNRITDCDIILSIPEEKIETAVQARIKDFGLKVNPIALEAVAGSHAVVIASQRPDVPNVGLHETLLGAMPHNSRCFIYGASAANSAQAQRLAAVSSARSISLMSGTASATAFQLPELDFPKNVHLRRALIVIGGSPGRPALEGLEGLFPFLERRRNGEAGIRKTDFVDGPALWQMAYSDEWAPLLSSAVSRSNTIKGDPERDGRTQDILGLRLMEKVATERRAERTGNTPMAWLLEHNDGLRTAMFVLDHALGDMNCAFQLRDGRILSTQLYLPPAPMQEHFSRLAAVLDDYLRTGQTPWQQNKPDIIAKALERIAQE